MSVESYKGNLFVVSAPSGAGKTSLVKALVSNDDNIGVAVSHTTRKQRPEEQDGVNYHFTDEAQFNAMVEAGEFLEWARVFDNLYGTSQGAVESVLAEGKHLVLEIDWQGAEQIRKTLPAAQTIFIFPPSYQALEQRLIARGQDDDATVERRMASALEETSHYREFDYLIVNDVFETALAEMSQIVHGDGDQFRRESQLERLSGLIGDLLPQSKP